MSTAVEEKVFNAIIGDVHLLDVDNMDSAQIDSIVTTLHSKLNACTQRDQIVHDLHPWFHDIIMEIMEYNATILTAMRDELRPVYIGLEELAFRRRLHTKTRQFEQAFKSFSNMYFKFLQKGNVASSLVSFNNDKEYCFWTCFDKAARFYKEYEDYVNGEIATKMRSVLCDIEKLQLPDHYRQWLISAAITTCIKYNTEVLYVMRFPPLFPKGGDRKKINEYVNVLDSKSKS